jgi:uridine kinase
LIDLSAVGRRHATLLVGVDGSAGAGKSTLAATLSDKVVSTDDFITAPWAWYDFDRLRAQVLDPLLRDDRARYQRLDWNGSELRDWRTLEPGGVVVVEGVGALELRLRDAYDYRIWVETPREVCLRRGLERDGDDALPLWEAWFAREERYWAEQAPRASADIVASGLAL